MPSKIKKKSEKTRVLKDVTHEEVEDMGNHPTIIKRALAAEAAIKKFGLPPLSK